MYHVNRRQLPMADDNQPEVVVTMVTDVTNLAVSPYRAGFRNQKYV